MIEKLKLYLTEKGYQKIQVNVHGIYLYYLHEQFKIKLLLLIDCPTGAEFTRDQYLNMKGQICRNLSSKYDKMIETHTLFLTNAASKIRTVADNDNDCWIIDTTDYRLIIYENHNSDFAGIRDNLETLLSKVAGTRPDPDTDAYYHVNNTSNRGAYQKGRTYQNSEEEYDVPAYKNSRMQKLSPKYFSLCNTFLVVANVLIFIILDLLSQRYHMESYVNGGALYWPAVKYYNQYYRLITYMFLHSGLDHLVNNMIVLLFIGDNLERATGKWRYVIIYFGSGIVAGISSMGYNMLKNINAISVGASGSIFGVVGAMAYIVAVNKGRLENISTRQIFMFVCFSLYGGLTSQGVDNAAHIGGLLAGIILAAILYKRPKKRDVERG
jgi:rhomboid protease GluP